jgi:hypothetical protein
MDILQHYPILGIETRQEVQMRTMSLFRIFVFAGALALWQTQAHAQAKPQDIQQMIADGNPAGALTELQPILQAHPDSGVAWYLSAEAQDAQGNEAAARSALAKAEHYAPGLPFAKPADVAALQAHLGEGSAPAHSGIGFIWILLGGLVVLVFLARMMLRRRMAGYGQRGYPMQPPGPYGQAGPVYGQPGFGGGGVGSSLLGGLAAGAGFAAGERVIDDMMGGNRGDDQNFGGDLNNIPDRDDGLNGSPGWDSGSDDNGGGFDPGNNW